MNNLCEHQNSIIDQHEGSVVCIDCAQVLSDGLFFHEVHNEKTTLPEKKSVSEFSEYLSALNISSNFSFDCERELNKAKQILKVEKTDQSLISYALYNALLLRDVPRSMREISAITGINTSALWKIQSEIQKVTCELRGKNVSPVDLLERSCNYLNLSFCQMNEIKETLEKEKNYNYNPATIVGGHIYKYSKDKKLNLSLKKVSQTVGISVMSIQRYVRKNFKK